MAQSNFVELLLTCGSWQEAQRIADALLKKALIASAETLPDSRGKVHVIIQASLDNLSRIETEVAQLSSEVLVSAANQVQ